MTPRPRATCGSGERVADFMGRASGRWLSAERPLPEPSIRSVTVAPARQAVGIPSGSSAVRGDERPWRAPAGAGSTACPLAERRTPNRHRSGGQRVIPGRGADMAVRAFAAARRRAAGRVGSSALSRGAVVRARHRRVSTAACATRCWPVAEPTAGRSCCPDRTDGRRIGRASALRRPARSQNPLRRWPCWARRVRSQANCAAWASRSSQARSTHASDSSARTVSALQDN